MTRLKIRCGQCHRRYKVGVNAYLIVARDYEKRDNNSESTPDIVGRSDREDLLSRILAKATRDMRDRSRTVSLKLRLAYLRDKKRLEAEEYQAAQLDEIWHVCSQLDERNNQDRWWKCRECGRIQVYPTGKMNLLRDWFGKKNQVEVEFQARGGATSQDGGEAQRAKVTESLASLKKPAESFGVKKEHYTNDGNVESILAQQVLSEDKQALKIVVLESGVQVRLLSNLLIKAHQVPKDQITQLGPTCNDEQIDELLKKAPRIVLVSKDLINHSRCVFRLPTGSKRLVAIQVLDGEVSAFPITCEGSTFQFKSGWFS